MSIRIRPNVERQLTEPHVVQVLLSDPRAGWLWLLPRIWVGWSWLQAGWHKFQNPDWMQSGTALRGFWEQAVSIPATGRPAISFDWYRSFLQMLINAHAETWFSKLVVFGELGVGVLLILGAFTGIAAFLGGFMNWNFMMAGSASINPMLFVFSIGFILAWKVAGEIGLDSILLPLVGTPWAPSPAAPPQRDQGGMESPERPRV